MWSFDHVFTLISYLQTLLLYLLFHFCFSPTCLESIRFSWRFNTIFQIIGSKVPFSWYIDKNARRSQNFPFGPYLVNFSTANYRWWAYPVMLRSFIFTTPMWATFTMVRGIPWSPTVSVWHTHWFSTTTFTNICRYVAWALSLRFFCTYFSAVDVEKACTWELSTILSRFSDLMWQQLTTWLGFIQRSTLSFSSASRHKTSRGLQKVLLILT